MDPVSRRRALLAVAALAASPRIACAQQPSRPFRIAFLSNGSAVSAGSLRDALVRGLDEHGWRSGRDFVLEAWWADGKLDRLPSLVAEMLAWKPDLVAAPSGIAAQAAQKSGTTLPIVFALAPDPVGQGFGTSLARPGRNMTGLTSTHNELSGKRLELLKEAFPGTRHVAVLYYRALAPAGVAEQLAETERAARVLGLTLTTEESPRVDDFERAFAAMQRQRPDALVVIENPLFFSNRGRLAELAAGLRVPAIFNVAEYVQAGGLMSYGASYGDLIRRSAGYVVKILKGAAPGDLPIERPTKFELVINAKTARAIGVVIPQAILVRADSVVE